MNPSSRITRGAAVFAAAAVVAAGASTASAQTSAHPATQSADHGTVFSRVPFTDASVTANTSAGTLTVTWTAPNLHGGVAVYAGSAKTGQKHFVGLAAASTGTATVSAAYGDWIRLVPSSGDALVLTVRDLGLASDPNLRDVGGYRTVDGQWVRMGVVYRSQALSLSSSDLAVVDTLGITDDYDLRTASEIASSPDVVPTGATYTNLNVLADISLSPTLTSADAAAEYMQEIEQDFVTDATARAAFGSLLTGIADSKGASLYHCTAGKDRTGWATAVLLTLLGVPQDTVMQDYLLSNTYYFGSASVQALLKEMPAAEAAIYTPLLEVQASYLQAGLDQVKATYGSMYDYAVKGLGLSPRTIAKLRAKLLVG
ncbi:tyrosine-protein phosphatase [Actinospica sp. MGRD01-02]|uniref:Tyrosine-protein phosphatase n=1 Tax=Actinospica acidithermotolerans TaxID=2828514 RepID=A0A941EBE1_9ACTN|nr:tyrosine-protein phosphatase [Actinospica acidithermotolerans]MBR7828396.1 tyrosine-protein phosphatase [Actinospica acidithermotolerans]